jgi:ADP-ribosylation factor-binding protein GGA
MSAFNQPGISPQPTGTSTFSMFNNLSNAPSPNPQAASPPPQAQQSPPKPADPFASLSTASSTPRQPSPFQFQQSVHPPSAAPASGLIDIGSTPSQASAPVQAPPAQAAPPAQQSNGDDEWNFSSALPDQPANMTIVNSNINITMTVSRQGDVVVMDSKTSNNTTQPISNFAFQLAVMKVSHVSWVSCVSEAVSLTDRPGLHIESSTPKRDLSGTIAAEWYHPDHSGQWHPTWQRRSGEVPMESILQHWS